MATVARAVLALAAAAAVLAVVLSDATAQTVVPVLVSNEGRPSETALATASGRVSYAQSFRTGDHVDGYFLSSVELGLAVESGVSVEAKLLSSGPGAAPPGKQYVYPPNNATAVVLSQVSTPDDDASTLEEFAAVDVLLEPGTQYWIVVTKTAGADGGLSVGAVVDAGRIDAGGAAGWSVGDNVWAEGTTEWADYRGSAAVSMRIRLRGSEAVRPELGPYVSNRHKGYRAAVAKTSSSVTKYATAFTTGGHSGGLELTSVVLGVAAESGATPRVAIHADNSGSPAAAAVTGGTLISPTIASADLDLPGRAVFSAASAISLDASEKYWVVLDVGTGSGQVSVSTTTADAFGRREEFDIDTTAIEETLRSYDGSSWSVDGDARLFRMAVGGPTSQFSSRVRIGAPQVGVAVSAEVQYFGGRLRNVSFQWQRGAAEAGPFVNIPAAEGGTADRYIPLPGDLGMWLNAIATYDNAFVTGSTEQGVSLSAVLSQPILSNVGLISDIRYAVEGPALTKLAQPFTTGPEPSGYVLRGFRVGINVEAAMGEDISLAWALHADDDGEFRPAPAPLFDPIDIPVVDIVSVFHILELAHPGFVLAPGARYWLVLSWTHTNLAHSTFFTRSLAEHGDVGLVVDDGLAPLDPGSAAGWKMDFNALTYNTVDPPDPPRWRPQAVALEVDGRFALQMSVLADSATGPAAPSRLEASQGDGRVGLFWFAPVTDGGSAITHYEYRYQAGAGSYGAWTQAPDSDNDGDLADERKLVVSSLTNDTAHVFEIRAVNSAPQGEGPPAQSRSLTPLAGIPTLSVTVDPAKATGGIDYVTYTITRSGPTTDDLRVDYRMAPPEGNDWGSINTLEDYRDLLTNIAVRTVVYRLDDAPENSVGFSASATVGGTLEVQLFADGYDSIDAAAPVEVVVVEYPAWVVSFAESSYAFDEASGANSVTALLTATSTDMPAPWRRSWGTVGGISFTVNSNGRTATVAVDYETVADTVTPDVDSWAANADGYMEGSVEVELTLLDDAVVESDEELLLYFVGLSVYDGLDWLAYRGADGQLGGAVGTARNVLVTIRDDDAALSSVSVSSTPLLPLDAATKDTYGRNEAIVFAVQFSAKVDVTGTPEFTFVLDATDKQAEYSGGSGTDTLTFSYTVQLADEDDNGISWAANSVALAGGTINRAGTSGAAVLTHSLQANSSGHKVDGSMVSFSAPQFAADAAPRSVDENTASGNVGAAVAAVDADGDAVYHSVLATGASAAATAHLAAFHRHFELAETSGQITVRSGSLLNYEDRSSYVVRIEASDREDAVGMAESAPYTVDDTLTLTITLNNVDEAGTVTISGSPVAGQTLTASVSDPDGSVGVLSYQWSRSSSQNSGFSDIADADQSSYVVQDGDEGMYLRVTIEYADVHTSVKSEHATTTTPAAANAPENLSAAPGDRRVALSWDDPGDATIDRYQYRYRNTSDSGWRPDWTDIAASDAATTSHRLSGLTNGVEYTFQVRRMYLENGQDDPGAHGEVKSIPRGALGAPANLSAVSAGDGEIALSWDDPGDITITSYQYRLRHSSASAWNPDWAFFDEASTSHTLTGLDNNVRYTVEVRALRVSVGGPASRASATPRGPLRAPAGFTATPGDSRVELSWDATDDDSVSGYQYRRRLSSDSAWSPDWTDIARSRWTTTAYTVTGLSNRSAYIFQARALRGSLTGPASTARATPEGPPTVPPPPTQVIAFRTDDGHAVAWIRIANEDPRARVTAYRVRWRRTGTQRWTETPNVADADNIAIQNINALTNGTHYEIQVAAVNRVGTGAWASTSYTPQQAWGEALDEAETANIGSDTDLGIAGLFAYWTASYGSTNSHPNTAVAWLTLDSCTGAHSFRIYWDLPDGQSAADKWEAHIISRFGAGAVTHEFRTVDGYPEMIGSANLAGPASLTVRVRGAFGGVQGAWSPGVLLRCNETG